MGQAAVHQVLVLDYSAQYAIQELLRLNHDNKGNIFSFFFLCDSIKFQNKLK